jgi:hypothetical protein
METPTPALILYCNAFSDLLWLLGSFRGQARHHIYILIFVALK